MRRTELRAALLVLVLALGAVLLAGARSAAGRMLDLAEYRARSPYYLSLIHISEPTRPY